MGVAIDVGGVNVHGRQYSYARNRNSRGLYVRLSARVVLRVYDCSIRGVSSRSKARNVRSSHAGHNGFLPNRDEPMGSTCPERAIVAAHSEGLR